MVFSLSQVRLSLEYGMKAISEAGVRYLESQGEPHYGVAKFLSVDPPTPSVSWQYLIMRFYLSILLWIQCYILPTSVKSRFAQSHGRWVISSVTLGPILNLMEISCVSEVWSPEDAFLLTVPNLYGLSNGWFEVMSW